MTESNVTYIVNGQRVDPDGNPVEVEPVAADAPQGSPDSPETAPNSGEVSTDPDGGADDSGDDTPLLPEELLELGEAINIKPTVLMALSGMGLDTPGAMMAVEDETLAKSGMTKASIERLRALEREGE